MIRAVIFDLDGTLLDTERIYLECWLKSAAEFGFSLQREEALVLRSCSIQYAQPYIRNRLGDTFDYTAVRNRRRELVSEYIEKYGIQKKAGISELLSFCHNHGICTAIATATARELALERLEKAGVTADQFSVIIGGDEISRGKPEPDIYLAAIQTLGFCSEECVALEDSPNGIYSAFEAGCRTIMIPDLTKPTKNLQPMLFGVADNLKYVIPILESVGCS